MNDFYKRFLLLLSYRFREFFFILVLMIEESVYVGVELDLLVKVGELSKVELDNVFIFFDYKRLELYLNGLFDYYVVLDFVFIIVYLFFNGKLKDVKFSGL